MAVPATLLQLKTYDDLHTLPDDGNRYELIFGEIVMSPSPRTKHQLALAALFMQLKRFVDERQLGEVLFAPLDVKFSEYSVVQPDIFFVGREALSRLGELFLDGAPDIAIEALSHQETGCRISFGKRHSTSIMVSPVLGHRSRQRDDHDQSADRWSISGNTSYTGKRTSRMLPGFEIDVAAVFNIPGLEKASHKRDGVI